MSKNNRKIRNHPERDTMPIRVLVVDDSAFMRQIIHRMLEEDPEIEVVGTARDGQDALAKVHSFDPDVVTLDVAMPNMDGLECLRQIMDSAPRPVIMVSYLTVAGAEHTIAALELGAVDFVTKTNSNDPEAIAAIQQELTQKVKVAATIDWQKLQPAPLLPAAPAPEPVVFRKIKELELAVIGASTGGPRALQDLLTRIPPNFPLGIIVAQHMPKDFTKVFAKRLNDLAKVEIVEARSGDLVTPGRVLVAPSGYQTTVVRDGERLTVEVASHPPLIYKPSIDHLLRSVAAACQGRSLGIILTGMGSDGAQGLSELRRLGARTIAEAESSCVVYGMPRSAIELGGVEYVERLPDIYSRVVSILDDY